MTTSRWPAALVLENGDIFLGRGWGAQQESIGEVVFNTAITGYQEIVSDPSYAGQIVVMTATQIGNVGANRADVETRRVVCAGLAVREWSPLPASWRAEEDLGTWSERQGVPGIDDIDTRELTSILRDQGAMRGAITPHVGQLEEVLARVRSSPTMDGLDLVPRVTCAASYSWDQPSWRAEDERRMPATPAADRHVVAFDYGIKENILRQLRDVGCRVTVVPASTSAAEVLALAPDGLFLSNGPGDPAAVTYAISTVAQLLESSLPLFGICLGHQILALALGGRTFKLRFGHHGANHPVLDLATGKVEITSQNHGFAVDPASLPSGVEVSHTNLFDGSVAGLRVNGRPIFSVQYHPEASPGPHDSAYLFARFRAAIDERAAQRARR
jgi:carbamoyl-phosphate synthase small subunit